MIKKILFILLVFIGGFYPEILLAQVDIIKGSMMTMTPEEFINTYLLGSGVTVVPGTASFNGNSDLISNNPELTANQIGTFVTTGEAYNKLQLQGGIIMSSGNVFDAATQNQTCFPLSTCLPVSTVTNSGGDDDLKVLMEGVTSNDKSILEFDFIPQTNIVSFRYVFASEEFDEYCYDFNDAFGFLISGPGCGTTPPNVFTNNAENIALLPSTTDFVTINNICANPILYSWCNLTDPACKVGHGPEFTYNRFTYVFTASRTVVACSTYHMKICIGDAKDHAYDSGVFLEQNSFSSNNITFQNTYSVPGLGNFSVEGCSNATVKFQLSQPAVVDQTINFTLGGTATPDGPGVPNPDYGITPAPSGTPFPSSIVIPAGQSSADTVIYPYSDTEYTESDETVTISVTNTFCTGTVTSTDTIIIKNYAPLTVSVNPQPPVCSGVSVTLTAVPAGGQPSYTYLWNDGSTSNPATFNPPIGITTYSVTATDGCSFTASNSTSVEVSQTPHLTNPEPLPVCSGTTFNVILVPDVTGGNFTWTATCNPVGSVTGFTANQPVNVTFIDDVLTNNTTTPATVTYHITPHFNGCDGPTSDFTVTVNPTPHLTNAAPSPMCSAGTFNVTLVPDVTGGNFTWTAACNPFGSVTGFTADQPVNVTVINDILTNITTAPATVTYHITPHANGCDGPASDFTVTVNPTPHLTNSAPPPVCSEGTFNVTLVPDVTGGDFTWTATCNPVGSVTGFTAAQSANVTLINDVLTNTTTAPATVTYHITPHANGCDGPASDFTVTVNPTPHLTNSAPPPVCSAGTFNVTLVPDVSGGNFTWTATCNPVGSVTGFTAVQSVNVTLINDVLTNTTTTAPATVTYHITPHANGCDGPASDLTVTVNPTPHLTNAAPSPICSAGNFSVTLVPDVTGGDFTWTATCNPVGSVTGFTAAQTTNVTQISDILTNTTFAIGTVTYLITPHANSCDGPPTPFSVDVNPKPDVLFTSPPLNPQEVCSGSASVPVPLQSNVTLPVISYGWVAQAFDPVNPTTDISGFTTPNSGNTIPGENITSTLLNPGVIKYTVTATLSAGGAVCPGDPYQYQMIINPSPTVALTPSDPAGQTICSGETSQPITFTPNVTPTIYAWQAVEVMGVSGATASGTTDNVPAMTLTTTGATQGHVRYQVTPTYQGGGSFQCPGGVSYSTIFVNPLPTPQFSVISPSCEFGPPVQYQTASVADHSYLWDITGANTISGETTSQVTVSWGAAGTGTLRVRETNSITGCIQHYPPIGQPPLQVVLQQRPVPSLTGPSSICEASSGNLYQTDAGTNHDYTWLIDGGIITAGGDGFPTATVTWTNPGTTNWIEVNYINALGCPGYPPHRDIIQVNPLPVSSFTGSTSVCQLHPDAYLYPANSGPDCSYSWSISPSSAGSIANPTVSPASITWNTTGNASLRLDAITSFGCTSFSSQPITINPHPDVSITPCFDLVTTRSAKRFLLKGGIPLLTATPLQGEYLINPATVALVFESGNYYFDPTLVTGTNTVNFNLYYKYTSSQFGCPATSPNPVTITVFGANPACSSTMTDYRDNTTYRTSFVGGKCWMMENLRYGNPLTPTTTVQTDNCVAEKYCLSADPNCSAYGGFYQWDELIQYGVTASPEYQGVCPPGWHIPSAADFQALIDENQGNAMAGAIFKDLNLSPRGFEALLTGMAYLNIAWAFTSSANPAGTMFWTSTPGSGNKIVTRGMNSMVPSVSIYGTSKVNAFPVRCVKD